MVLPLVSVLVPVYNAAAYIFDAITSILNQTYANFELIVLDDASTDESVSVIKEFKDSRIRLHQSQENLGLAKQLNRGILLSRGDFIARMDADDISLAQRLEFQTLFLVKNSSVDVVGSFIETFGDKSEIRKYPCDHEEIKASLVYSNPLAHPTVMFRKSAFSKYGLQYDPAYVPCEDLDLWCRAIKFLRFANIPVVLLKYRLHSNNLSSSKLTRSAELNRQIRYRFLELSNILDEREFSEIVDPKIDIDERHVRLKTIDRNLEMIYRQRKGAFERKLFRKILGRIRDYIYFSYLYRAQDVIFQYFLGSQLRAGFLSNFSIFFHFIKLVVKRLAGLHRNA